MANQKEVNEIIRKKIMDLFASNFLNGFKKMGATEQRAFIEALEGLMEESAVRPEEVSSPKSENSA